jgi:hypothetical protein
MKALQKRKRKKKKRKKKPLCYFDYKSYVKILPDHVLQHNLSSFFELAKFP